MTFPIQSADSGVMMSQVNQTRMTESQKTSFQEIISRYDATNFSQTDFEAMGEELRQAGIGRTHEAKLMLEDAGFNIDQFAKGGPGEMHGPSGLDSMVNGLNLQQLQSLQEVLNNFDLTNMSSEDEENLMDKLMNSGLLQSGLTLNTQA